LVGAVGSSLLPPVPQLPLLLVLAGGPPSSEAATWCWPATRWRGRLAWAVCVLL